MVSRQSQTMVRQARVVQPAKPSCSASKRNEAQATTRWEIKAAQRLLRDGVIQANLTINRPGDRFEQEADRVADAVMRMPEPRNAHEGAGVSISRRPSPLATHVPGVSGRTARVATAYPAPVLLECDEELNQEPGENRSPGSRPHSRSDSSGSDADRYNARWRPPFAGLGARLLRATFW